MPLPRKGWKRWQEVVGGSASPVVTAWLADGRPPGPYLILDGVAVERRGRRVVQVEHLSIGSGSCVLTGANASGKSSLLMAVAGLVRGAGEVRVVNAVDGQGRQAIGYMPQEPTGLDHLTVVQAVRFAQVLTGATVEVDAARHVEAVGLSAQIDERISRLSGGQRRLAYLATLLAQPASVLLLDEPTVGLDASHRLAVRQVLVGAASSRVVVTATHLPDDLEALGERMIVLRRGEVVFDGTSAAFRGSQDWDGALSEWELS